MIKCKISDMLGCALIFTIIALVILSAINIEGALDDTSKWIFFLLGALIATIGSVLGGSE